MNLHRSLAYPTSKHRIRYWLRCILQRRNNSSDILAHPRDVAILLLDCTPLYMDDVMRNINIKHDELLMFREKEECVMG